MTSKILTNKLGLKSPVPKCDKDVDKLKKENVALKKKLEESSKSKMSDKERNRLLEKILDLETQTVKNSQDLANIRNHNDELNAKNKRLAQEANEESRRIENLSSDIRTQLTDVPPRIVQPKTSVLQTGQDPPKEAALSNVHILEAQLKDALEKNQQWLVYDQQREAYVQGLVARIFDLEQQVASTKQNKEKEISCDENDKQRYYDQLLIVAKKDLEGERQITEQLNSELSEMRKKLKEKEKEAADLSTTLKSRSETERQQRDDCRLLKDKMQRLKRELDVYQEMYEEEKRKNSELSEMQNKLEEKKKEAADLSTALKSRSETERQQRDDCRLLKDKMQRLKRELDVYQEMYEEEKSKNSELSIKIEKMQSLLMRQQEDQQKVAVLEQQIQKCTSDLENEKIDRDIVQHQLYKVLKELRKTREQITKLEPGKGDIYFVDASSNFASEFEDKLSKREKYPSPKPRNLLDESFLECPRCQTMYPTSQHRELLAHIDICTS